MANNEEIQLIVWWGDQRRPIKININDDLKTIEKKISVVYQLQQGDNLSECQPQYYDSNYQRFIDLYPDSFSNFQQLLGRLSSPEAPAKPNREWTIKIVSKIVQPIRQTIRQAITCDDTYSYQLENDPCDLHKNEDTIATNLQTPAVPDGSSNDNTKILPRDLLTPNTHIEVQAPPQLTPQLSRSGAANVPIVAITDHPCKLRYEAPLVGQQRLQYEKDMCRSTSTKSAKGGVLLHACPKPGGASSSDKSYPVVHFQIPSEKESQEWHLILFILTKPDGDGNYYLHSSKGIYLGDSARESRCCAIRDSYSVNPYAIRLTPKQIQDGAVEILIKVCSVRDLPTRKKEPLTRFSQSMNQKDYNQLTSLSTNTMHSLQIATEKFHLGCTLICGETIYDQCISNLITAAPSRKREDCDAANLQVGQCKKTKT